jgi:hypothetical protein
MMPVMWYVFPPLVNIGFAPTLTIVERPPKFELNVIPVRESTSKNELRVVAFATPPNKTPQAAKTNLEVKIS